MPGVFRARHAREMSQICTDYLFSCNINRFQITPRYGTGSVATGIHFVVFSSPLFVAIQNDTSRMRWLSLPKRERFCQLILPRLRRSTTNTSLSRCLTTVVSHPQAVRLERIGL